MYLGAGLVSLGMLIELVSFVFAVLNMKRGVNTMLFSTSPTADPFQGFGSMFTGHIGTMVGMATGGVVAIIGIVVLVMQFLK